MASPNSLPVVHNPAASRFEVTVEGRLAVADYVLEGGTMIITHTFVPPELRGRGLAEQLVRAALGHARAARLRVNPACSYVESFIARHPEYADLLADRGG
jgi:hypothetical protein